ncbi:hypothetical protein JTB14_021621 [Gonioctena quinquepunctata]|nr:hypothetical protein JTB14_021621 [Gonioctena quinquepunctata]
MKQIVNHDFPVKLPGCMYNLKNIQSQGANGMVNGSVDHVATTPSKKLDIFDQNNHQIGGMAELEDKQEKILKQLAELKQQILTIKQHICPKTTSSSVKIPQRNISHQDIVINVSPTNPPYSLEIIQKLLQDRVSLVFTTHLHSTVSSLTENAKQLENALLNFSPKSGVSKINVKLIWKNGEFDETFISVVFSKMKLNIFELYGENISVLVFLLPKQRRRNHTYLVI